MGYSRGGGNALAKTQEDRPKSANKAGARSTSARRAVPIAKLTRRPRLARLFVDESTKPELTKFDLSVRHAPLRTVNLVYNNRRESPLSARAQDRRAERESPDQIRLDRRPQEGPSRPAGGLVVRMPSFGGGQNGDVLPIRGYLQIDICIPGTTLPNGGVDDVDWPFRWWLC